VNALPRWIVPAVLVVVLLVAGSSAYQHFANRGVSPATRDSIAVLKASKRPDSIAHAQLVTTAESATVHSVALSAQSKATERRAAQSDSLAKIAAQRATQAQSARDSAALWRQAYEAESTSAAGLRVALEDERAATAEARAATITALRADSASQDRLARVERLNATLVSDVNRLSGGCRLVPDAERDGGDRGRRYLPHSSSDWSAQMMRQIIRWTGWALIAALCVAGPLTAQTSTVPAELPRVTLSTPMPATVRTLRVAAGGNLQAALDSATPGDAIELARGATFSGHFTLPNKGSGTAWIVLRPASGAALPPEGTRMTPALAASLALPKIITPDYQAALATAHGAHHWRLVGVEITADPAAFNYGLVLLGDGSHDQATVQSIAHDLVLDRVYVHGNPTTSLSRCVALNSAATAIVDSYLSECHAEGQDAQAIAGWNGPGPFKIVNNYLEGSGENIIFGGADPAVPGLVPSDIEIRHNHVAKPASWHGGRWLIKNLLELKNAERVLIEGNLFEGSWRHGQEGFAFVLWSANQEGSAPQTVTQDVTVRRNIIRRVGAGIAISAGGYHPAVNARRFAITENLIYAIDGPGYEGNGRAFQLGGGLLADVAITRNTVLDATLTAFTFAGDSILPRFTARDNILEGGAYGIIGDGTGVGMGTLTRYVPGGTFTNNVLRINPEYASLFPGGNAYPATMVAIGFVDAARGDFHLAASSPYQGIGAPIDSVLAAIAGVVEGVGPTPSIPTLTLAQIRAALAALVKVTGPTGREANATKAALVPIADYLRALTPP
jgi:hypothetical protein